MHQVNPEDASEPAAGRFRILGVGGAGCRILETVVRSGLEGATYTSLNTDVEALRHGSIPTRIQLGARLTRGLGAGGDCEVGSAAAREAESQIARLCQGAEIVLLLAGLGGGTGTGAAPVIARIARESGALVIALVTLPFSCEGGRRQRNARKGLEELRGNADAVLCLPNDRVLSLIDENTSVIETFRSTAELVSQGVNALKRLAGTGGIIPVDLADLCEMLRQHRGETYFATAEASGPNRTREALEQLLMSPLLENGHLLRQASSVLVSVVAGADLTIGEVNRIAEQLRRECESAEFLLGAAADPTMGRGFRLTLIGTRPVGETPTQAQSPTGASAIPTASSSLDPAEHVETDFFRRQPAPRRPRARFLAPPPELSTEQKQDAASESRRRVRARARTRMEQAMLPLEVVSRGRFEKSEPTIFNGEDLDVPTFVRRGWVLN